MLRVEMRGRFSRWPRRAWAVVSVILVASTMGAGQAHHVFREASSTFRPPDAAWENYYNDPFNQATWAPFCAGGGGSPVPVASAFGVPACGPTGSTDIYLPENPNAKIRTHTQGFQCVELVERYLDVRYGLTPPISADDEPITANGAQVVETYAAQYNLSIIKNDVGQLPAVGDVMSFSSTPGFTGTGHTAIVTASSATSVSIIGENQTAGGTAGIFPMKVSGGTIESFDPKYPYIEWLNNSAVKFPEDWAAAKAPLPANATTTGNTYVSIPSVSCPSSTCVAVGGYQTSSGTGQGLLLSGSGSSWKPTEARLPSATPTAVDGVLDSVACPASSECVAVGSYVDSDGFGQGLLLTGSGSSWKPAEAPLPGDASSTANPQVNAVACGSTGQCVAVGEYASTNWQGLLLTDSGGSWKAARAPLPPNATSTGPFAADVLSVACPSPSSCAAVGYYFDSSGQVQGLLLTDSGGSWKPKEAPLPVNGTPGEGGAATALDSVSCPTASDCVAVGGYDSSGAAQGLIETGRGTSWTPAEAPLPSDAESGVNGVNLNSVACVSSSECVAGGYYDSQEQGLLLSGWGTSWTPAEAPLPSGAATPSPEAEIDSVACPSAFDCVAVGSYSDSSSHQQVLLVTGIGLWWSADYESLPPGGQSLETGSAVQCTSPADCVAVGSYEDTSGDLQGLLLSGTG